MNCKQCGNPIDENKLVCQNCGYQGPLNEERAKLEELRERKKNLVFNMVKKPIFLALTIAISVATVINIINILRGDVSGLIESLFMGISAVGLWSCYLAKDNGALNGALRNASLYDAYNRIIYTVLAVVDVVVFGLVAAVMFVLSADKSGPLAGSGETVTVLAVAALIVGAISVAIKLLFRSVYKKRREYFLELGKFVESGSYTAKKPSPVGSYVIGAMSAISGLSSLGMSLLSTTLSSIVMNVLSSLAPSSEIAALLPLAEAMLIAIFGGLAIGAVSKLAVGLYYILSAVWMTSVHEEACAANSAIDHQNVRRLDFERKSKAEYEEWERVQSSECRVQSEELGERCEEASTEDESVQTPIEETNREPKEETNE